MPNSKKEYPLLEINDGWPLCFLRRRPYNHRPQENCCSQIDALIQTITTTTTVSGQTKKAEIQIHAQRNGGCAACPVLKQDGDESFIVGAKIIQSFPDLRVVSFFPPKENGADVPLSTFSSPICRKAITTNAHQHHCLAAYGDTFRGDTVSVPNTILVHTFTPAPGSLATSCGDCPRFPHQK